jgi:hypothetical protein
MNNEIICERCKFQPGYYTCDTCQPLNIFCLKCDNYLHSLPSKKQHKRMALLNEKTKNIVNSIYNDETKSKQVHEVIGNKNIIPTFKDNKSSLHYNKPYDHQFTREYVNELIRVYEKEKDELIYKNSTLQASLDRIKASFGLQIQELQREIEEINKNNSNNVEEVEKENQKLLREIIYEKDEVISRLTKQLEEYKECNQELIGKFKENIQLNKNQSLDSKARVNELSQELKLKQTKIDEIQQYYESHIDRLTKLSEEEKRELRHNFESLLHKSHKEIVNTKEDFEEIIKEKEREIIILKEKLKDEEKYYQNINKDLSVQVEDLTKKNSYRNNKFNLVREENDLILKDLNIIQKSEQMKENYIASNIKMYSQEISSYKSQVRL